ncbi:MAG: hypothetical protein ACFCUL_09795 [Flavobacteriaceae bacterium]
MYNQILSGLYNSVQLNTDESRKKYLESLQEKVRNIRKAYLTFPVRFAYTNKDTQAGYLITYVPHYSDLIYFALRDNRQSITINNVDDVYFIGSGPCPEIIGLLRYLKDYEGNAKFNLNINVLDIAIQEWKWSRDIVFNNVVPTYLNGSTINRKEGKIDISQNFKVNFNDSKKLVIFQNCLNEIDEQNHIILIQNVQRLFDQMSVGSYLLIIDLNFRQVLSLITEVENNLTNKGNCNIIRNVNDGEINNRTLQDNEPQIILDHLLTDRFGCENPNFLLPKRRLKFIYTLIQKK